jgi:hypothetical protein
MSRRRQQGHDSAEAYAAQTTQWDRLHREVKYWTEILDEVDAAITEHDTAKAAYEVAVDVRKHEDPSKAPGRLLPYRPRGPQ